MSSTTISPGQIKTGPGVIRYAALGTAIPSFTAAGNKVVGTWTGWVDPGGTDAGLTYNEDTSTEAIKVAESVYTIRKVVTEKNGKVSFSMSQISDINWKLACNGGTITTSGTGATKLNVYVPPLIGAEVSVMLSWTSLEDDEVMVWPQVFNTGSLEIQRGTPEQVAGLPVEFDVELPDPAVMLTPYKRWTAGALAQF